MEIDPIDFFPGYEPSYGARRRASTRCFYNSMLISICTHLLAMIFAVGICAGAFFYYGDYLKNAVKYDDLFNMVNKGPRNKLDKLNTGSENKKFDDIVKEMDRIKGEIERTNVWRKHLDELFSNIYLKQENIVENKIEKALDLYDSDKVGLFDYASVYACGSIISTPDTIPYPANKSISFFNLLNVEVLSNPEMMLQPNNFPSNCFAFHGPTGKIRIKLGRKISVKAVTMDHIKFMEDISSAPKDFEIYGLRDPTNVGGISLGKFSYDIEGRPYQTFYMEKNVTNEPFEFVELFIITNHGRRDFTCIYRFRVHGSYLE